MKLFWTFFVSYMVTLLIPFFLTIHLYIRYEEQVKQSIVEEDTRRLLGTKHTIESGMEEIDNIAELISLSQDLSVVSRIGDPFNPQTIYRFVRAIRSLPNYSLTNSLVLDYFIYLGNGSAVINYHFLYDSSKFVQQYLHIAGLPGDSLLEAFGGVGNKGPKIYPAQTVTTGSSEIQAIPCFYPWNSSVSSSILILLRDSAFQESLQTLLTYQGSAAFIIDSDGNAITGSGEHWEPLAARLSQDTFTQGNHQYLDVDGQKMLAIYSPSDKLGWMYVLVEPVDKILEEVTSFRNLNLLTILGIFLLGLGLSTGFALSKYEPIRGLVQYLDSAARISKKRGASEFQYIRTSLQELNEDNQQMKGRIEEQKPLLMNAFLLRLCQGRFLTREDFTAHASLLDFPAEGYSYAAVLVCDRFHGKMADKQTLASCQEGRIKLASLLEHVAFPSCWYLCEVDDRKTALLYTARQYDQTAFRRDVQWLTQQMNAGGSSRYFVLASDECPDPLQISSVFVCLVRAADIGRYPEDGSAIFPEPPPPNTLKTAPFYSVSIEDTLMSAIKSGDERLLRSTLNELYRRNFMEQTLPIPMLRVLLCQLLAALIKAAQYYNLPLENYQYLMDDWDDGKDLLLHQKITQSFLELCRTVGEKNQEQECSVIARIETYIRQNYSDPDLSLKQLSEKFHISPAYLSHLFKQKTNLNFAEYIESLRIRQAKDLLVSSAFPIEAIAQKSGYSSHNTFSRAFKRLTGLSATEYRKISKQP